jgi:hypothetical protein
VPALYAAWFRVRRQPGPAPDGAAGEPVPAT